LGYHSPSTSAAWLQPLHLTKASSLPQAPVHHFPCARLLSIPRLVCGCPMTPSALVLLCTDVTTGLPQAPALMLDPHQSPPVDGFRFLRPCMTPCSTVCSSYTLPHCQQDSISTPGQSVPPIFLHDGHSAGGALYLLDHWENVHLLFKISLESFSQ
jgi:hypothetical protein